MGGVARLAILDRAGDESALWELPRGLRQIEHGVTRELYPAMPVDELRPVLEQLIRDGHVEVYEMSEPDVRLTIEAAIAIVADNMNWASPDVSGRDRHFAVFCTESGEQEYRREYEGRH